MAAAKKGLAMSYTRELDYVPFFRQKPGVYCGPANAQMVLDGSPDSSKRVKYDQDYLFNIIKAHNSTTPPDPDEWNTDPKGLRDCLQCLSTPPGWLVYSKQEAEEVMQFILKSIHGTGFPIPVTVGPLSHWVLIVGWQTNAEPTGANKPKLMRIHIFDPQNKSAAHSHISAETWMSTDYFVAVDGTGTWGGRYVAVGQGPL